MKPIQGKILEMQNHPPSQQHFFTKARILGTLRLVLEFLFVFILMITALILSRLILGDVWVVDLPRNELLFIVLFLGGFSALVGWFWFIHRRRMVEEKLEMQMVELKKAEIRLRESEMMFRQMAENIRDIFWIRDLQQNRVLYVSPLLTSIFDLAVEEVYADPDLILKKIFSEDQPGAVSCLQQLREGKGIDYEFRMHQADGSFRWLRARTFPITNEQGEIYRVAGVAEDISEIKEIERALRDSEARLSALVENINAVVCSLDRNFRLLSCNRQFLDIYEQSAHVRPVIGEVLAPPAWAPQYLKDWGEMTRRAFGGEQLLLDYKQDVIEGTRDIEVGLSPIRDAEGQIAGITAFVRDISRRKAYEEEREKLISQIQAANERLGALSMRMIEVQEIERRKLALELHDELGQILNSVKLSLDMMEGLPPDEAQEQLKTAQELTSEMVQRVRQISLDLRPAMLDDMGLLSALLWHLKRYQKQTGIEVVFTHQKVDGRFPSTIETALYRIVQEALTNVSRHSKATLVKVDLWADESDLHLQIFDNGIGFNLFEISQSRRSSGLSGMRERARLLGGDLAIEAQAGEGTVLSMTVPIPGY